jgi:hypothetical protein
MKYKPTEKELRELGFKQGGPQVWSIDLRDNQELCYAWENFILCNEGEDWFNDPRFGESKEFSSIAQLRAFMKAPKSIKEAEKWKK